MSKPEPRREQRTVYQCAYCGERTYSKNGLDMAWHHAPNCPMLKKIKETEDEQ